MLGFKIVAIWACHAGGRGFESRPLRQEMVLYRPIQTYKSPET